MIELKAPLALYSHSTEYLPGHLNKTNKDRRHYGRLITNTSLRGYKTNNSNYYYYYYYY
jgi:hypothetical protein